MILVDEAGRSLLVSEDAPQLWRAYRRHLGNVPAPLETIYRSRNHDLLLVLSDLAERILTKDLIRAELRLARADTKETAHARSKETTDGTKGTDPRGRDRPAHAAGAGACRAKRRAAGHALDR